MPQYPPLEGPVPSPWNHDHLRVAEDGLRSVAVTDAILRQCERCKIHVDETRKECDNLCDFFQHFLAENKGQNSSLMPPVGG